MGHWPQFPLAPSERPFAAHGPLNSKFSFGAFGARNVTGNNGNKYYNGTNVEGSLIKGRYQLYDNVKLGFGWSITDVIKNDVSGTDKTTHRFSFDVIFSF